MDRGASLRATLFKKNILAYCLDSIGQGKVLPLIHCFAFKVVTVCHRKLNPLLTDVWHLKVTPRWRQMLCLARPCPTVQTVRRDEKPAMLLVDGVPAGLRSHASSRGQVCGRDGGEEEAFREETADLEQEQGRMAMWPLSEDPFRNLQGTECASWDLCKVSPSLRHMEAIHTHLLRTPGCCFLQPGLHSQGEGGLIMGEGVAYHEVVRSPEDKMAEAPPRSQAGGTGLSSMCPCEHWIPGIGCLCRSLPASGRMCFISFFTLLKAK
ncbi:uncharacterized protein LOC119149656 [Falco rusticolus]|uniref:uncharacterized protein LOC114014820 n=1 Tax=Falco cherrug TaxID=345164 RepID=UPI000FFBF5D6|nr:uncharacterized protein LOC114014820 [Falco cherrug]XP_037247075.1 uncharacterized protein LOC119149656 [Falco rusticolus]